MNYPTPHINATPDDFGQTVLMPGDPLRSKYIAEHFLENARLVNNVRGVQGYTGTYHGVKVSVMASGMGIPSIGIYSYELYNAFGVQNIMRIGSAGSINPDIHVRDIVIAQGACTDSNFLHQYHIDGTFAPIASYEMLRRAVASCEQVGATYHVGNVLSTDNFYNDDEGMPEDNGKKLGTLVDVMQTGANDVFVVKMENGKEVLLPVIKDCVLDINAEEKKIVVHMMNGLLD